MTYQQPSATGANVRCDTWVTKLIYQMGSNDWQLLNFKSSLTFVQNGQHTLTAFEKCHRLPRL